MQPYPKITIIKAYFLRCILLRKEVRKLLLIEAFKSPKGRLKRADFSANAALPKSNHLNTYFLCSICCTKKELKKLSILIKSTQTPFLTSTNYPYISTKVATVSTKELHTYTTCISSGINGCLSVKQAINNSLTSCATRYPVIYINKTPIMSLKPYTHEKTIIKLSKDLPAGLLAICLLL
jgi:hypothetical protein